MKGNHEVHVDKPGCTPRPDNRAYEISGLDTLEKYVVLRVSSKLNQTAGGPESISEGQAATFADPELSFLAQKFLKEVGPLPDLLDGDFAKRFLVSGPEKG